MRRSALQLRRRRRRGCRWQRLRLAAFWSPPTATTATSRGGHLLLSRWHRPRRGCFFPRCVPVAIQSISAVSHAASMLYYCSCSIHIHSCLLVFRFDPFSPLHSAVCMWRPLQFVFDVGLSFSSNVSYWWSNHAVVCTSYGILDEPCGRHLLLSTMNDVFCGAATPRAGHAIYTLGGYKMSIQYMYLLRLCPARVIYFTLETRCYYWAP